MHHAYIVKCTRKTRYKLVDKYNLPQTSDNVHPPKKIDLCMVISVVYTTNYITLQIVNNSGRMRVPE